MNPFDFLTSINKTKVNLLNEDPENIKNYDPFLVNRSLSYFQDTVFLANEMNKCVLPKDMQYNFYLNGVSKKSRFSKWVKADVVLDDAEILMKELSYSKRRAIDAVAMLKSCMTEIEYEKFIDLYKKGGR
jgi:hypothetical protein